MPGKLEVQAEGFVGDRGRDRGVGGELLQGDSLQRLLHPLPGVDPHIVHVHLDKNNTAVNSCKGQKRN